jgi:transposase
MASLKGIFGVSQPTITNWFDSWQQEGIAALRNKSGQGRKSILTEADKEAVKIKVKESPQQLKKAIQELKAELDKEFSQKTLERYLKKLVTPFGNGQGKR